jgi:hypothetical protein
MLMKLEFPVQSFGEKVAQMSSFIKIRLVEAELFHADGKDGRIDMTKLIVAFRKFANAPNNDEW